MGLLLAPIILIMFAGVLLLSTFSSAFNSVLTGGEIYYDENDFRDYASAQYAEHFGQLEDYEDALLIVFVVEPEQCHDYAYIAFAGHHLETEIDYMFGSNGTKFGNAIESSAINAQSYKYSLDSGIARVMKTMENHIKALEYEDNLTCKNEYPEFDSKLVNKSELDMNVDTVNSALVSFTEATGIPVVVVVDDADDVLPRDFDYFSVIIAGVIIVIAIVLIVKTVKNRKAKQDDGSYRGGDGQNGGYNNGYNNNGYNNNGNYNSGNSGW